MELYGGIDLHSNNSVVALLGEEDRVVLRKQFRNDLPTIVNALKPYQKTIVGLVVESTYNWYWLVDGLMTAGHKVHLAHPAATKQYEGIKHTDDKSDATWLAQLLRMGILPEGYIYPKEERGMRDLARKRCQLVGQRTRNILSIQSQLTRNTSASMASRNIQRLTETEVLELLGSEDVALGVNSNCAVVRCLNEQIKQLEAHIVGKVKLRPAFKQLKTVDGIGQVLALTIMLETGDIRRFPSVGDFSSYCRCVSSQKFSNGKQKGSGNRKNGNRYLAWAFGEAAHFAIRYDETIRRYYQRKLKKAHPFVAMKAVSTLR